jgi:1-phosphofructokinase family hexose kinase
MLLIITPNPALDRTMVVPDLHLGRRHRAERVLLAAGGKGLNVARVAHTLEQQCVVSAPLGGLTGQMVAHLAKEEGVEGRWVWHSAGETRTCVLVVDPNAHDATPLDEHGPTLSTEDWFSFLDVLMDIAEHSRLVTICGSLPPGIEPAALTELISRLAGVGRKVIVDTSNKALSAAIDAVPYGIKVNNQELGYVLGRPLESLEEAKMAALELRNRGICLVVVSLGAEGVLAASEAGVCHVLPPPLDVVSTVGCGDSLLAGLATGILRGLPLHESLQLGVACGSSDALTIGGGLVIPADVMRIRDMIRVRWIG